MTNSEPTPPTRRSAPPAQAEPNRPKPADARAKRPRRTQQISGVQIMFAAILAIGLILAINFSARITASQPLEAFHEQTLLEIDLLQAEQATLVADRDFAASDGFVETWARQDGKMVRPGEVLVIPLPLGAAFDATPTPAPFVEVVTSPEEPSPWELWWALFFDSQAPDL